MKKSILIIAMLVTHVGAYAAANDSKTTRSQNSETNESFRLLSTMETLRLSSELGLNEGEELSARTGIRAATPVEVSYFGIDIRVADQWENRWFIYKHNGITTVFRLKDIYKNSSTIIVNLDGSFSPIYDIGIQEYQNYSYGHVFRGFENPRVQLRIHQNGSYSVSVKGMRDGELVDIVAPREGSI